MSAYESPWMNEELRMYRKALREFIKEEFVPRQAKWREQQRPDAADWKQAGETGLLLPDVPEEYGGAGGSFCPSGRGDRRASASGSELRLRRAEHRLPLHLELRKRRAKEKVASRRWRKGKSWGPSR